MVVGYGAPSIPGGTGGRGSHDERWGMDRPRPGDMAKRPSKAFVRKGAVAFCDQRPAAEVAPDYEPLPPRR